jgi:hypothetical protein
MEELATIHQIMVTVADMVAAITPKITDTVQTMVRKIMEPSVDRDVLNSKVE